MIFNTAVTTTTREYILKKVFDQVTTGTPGLMTFLQRPKEWTSGTSYKFPIKYQDTTNGGNMGIADRLDTDRQNVRVNAEFNLKAANKPVVVAIAETTANMGDEQIVNLLDTEFDSQAQSLMNVMGQNLFTGNGSGNDWDSLANAASDSTLFATYGGLSRSTYSAWSGYYLASTGALTLAKLATADDAVTIGVDSPDMAFTTKAIWSTYESLLTPTVRANFSTSGYPRMNAFGGVSSTPGLGAQQGFVYLTFRGTPIAKDEQVPSGKYFLVNSKAFGFVGFNYEDENIMTANFKKTSDAVPSGVPGNVKSTRGFQFRKMMAPVDQLTKVGYLIYAGNFVGTNCRLNGTLAGAS
tara:strand:- start:7489 stop:8547 length:1059 start_codon:yes stop_codon:yes gene_type:complete